MPKQPLPRVPVLGRTEFTQDLFRLELGRPEGFVFKAGQYCTIGVDGIERPYSIVSSPAESAVELFIERVEGGALTPRLHHLKPGDEVTFRPTAKGVFTLAEGTRHHLMVATVTGIAPFVSMLREGAAASGGSDFYVLHGASYQDELAYRDELMRLAAARNNVHYLPAVSRPSESRNQGWVHETGRIHNFVEPLLSQHGLTQGSTVVYACGHPGMVTSVKQEIGALGFTVQEERYWKA